jgi:hypothetical protein
MRFEPLQRRHPEGFEEIRHWRIPNLLLRAMAQDDMIETL